MGNKGSSNYDMSQVCRFTRTELMKFFNEFKGLLRTFFLQKIPEEFIIDILIGLIYNLKTTSHENRVFLYF